MMRGKTLPRSASVGRFLWRTIRNFLCALPGGRPLLFPTEALATGFGRGDVEYALQVYRHHALQLDEAGFSGARELLEIGPGRNLGTALLWWSRAVSGDCMNARVTLWDVHANANPSSLDFWPKLAAELLNVLAQSDSDKFVTLRQREVLAEVAAHNRVPTIHYRVCSTRQMEVAEEERHYDLILSHASLEHVWEINRLWFLLGKVTALRGWHSHRIDLADHGRRRSNYLEMLEWSPLAWWLSMRFIPGAINRWRAREHEAAMRGAGIEIILAKRELRDELPVPRIDLARAYRDLDDAELRTTAIDLVGRSAV